jgi:hypothetical protein
MGERTLPGGDREPAPAWTVVGQIVSAGEPLPGRRTGWVPGGRRARPLATNQPVPVLADETGQIFRVWVT